MIRSPMCVIPQGEEPVVPKTKRCPAQNITASVVSCLVVRVPTEVAVPINQRIVYRALAFRLRRPLSLRASRSGLRRNGRTCPVGLEAALGPLTATEVPGSAPPAFPDDPAILCRPLVVRRQELNTRDDR